MEQLKTRIRIHPSTQLRTSILQFSPQRQKRDTQVQGKATPGGRVLPLHEMSRRRALSCSCAACEAMMQDLNQPFFESALKAYFNQYTYGK